MIDIAQLDVVTNSAAGVPVDIYLPTGEKAGFTISVLGSNSDAHKAAMLDMNRKIAERKKAVDDKNVTVADLKEQESARLDAAAAIVTGWDGLESGGKPYPFSREAARALFASAPYIAGQVLASSGDDARFLPQKPAG